MTSVDPTLARACHAPGATGPVDAPAAELDCPVAPIRPTVVRSPHGDRIDPYAWLRDDDPVRKRPEVLAYLAAENAWTDAQARHLGPLRDAVLAELRGRLQQDDQSVPVHDRGFWYWSRYDAGAEHPVHLRRRGAASGPDPAAPEQLVLDVAACARPHARFELGDMAVSPDERLLACTYDTTGRRSSTLRVRDLAAGAWLPDVIDGALEMVEWAADSRTLFYVRQDPLLLQSGPVFRHVLGTDPATDTCVFAEADDAMFVSIAVTSSRAFLMIEAEGDDSTELRVIPTDRPTARPRLVLPRKAGVRHYADHLDGRWVILTNERARNFRLVQAPERVTADRRRWTTLVPGRRDVTVDDFLLFERALVIQERAAGNATLRVLPWAGGGRSGSARPAACGPGFVIDADEAAFAMAIDDNPDPAATHLRYAYLSMITPATVIDADLRTGERVLRRVEPVPGYQRSRYDCTRIHVPARDGTRIPVSLAWRTDAWRRDGTAPLLIRAYGAYGDPFDPEFDPDLVSLLDRGFLLAIAHVRGGGELGEDWYDAGRLDCKINSFHDFIDVTRQLLRRGYGARGKVFAEGASAGGLLMAGVANMAGALYRGMLLQVPFVDVLTSMLDATLPLTTQERSEWGDPRRRAAYDTIAAYSPYDNLRARRYPAMLVTAALWDAQVPVHEPAKYVARLRRLKTDQNPLWLQVEMEAGHGGKAGRYERLPLRALELAFLVDLAQRPEPAARTSRGASRARR